MKPRTNRARIQQNEATNVKTRNQVLPIDTIRLDFQPSICLFEEKVQENVGRLRSGEKLPPLVVRFDGTNYWLQDGFHRIEAATRMGFEKVEAEIIAGTLADMEQEFKEMVSKAMKKLRRQSNYTQKVGMLGAEPEPDKESQ